MIKKNIETWILLFLAEYKFHNIIIFIVNIEYRLLHTNACT